MDPASQSMSSAGHASRGPGMLRVLPTVRCNMACSTCNLRAEMLDAKQRHESSPDSWRRVINEAAPFKPYIYFAGGEPLLYEGLPELIRSVKAAGLHCGLTTNGWLLSRWATALVHAGVDDIWVSIDGQAATHDRLRLAPGAFERALEGLRLLHSERRRAGRAQPRIHVNAVLNPSCSDAVEYVVHTRSQFHCDSISIQHLSFHSQEARARHAAEGFGGTVPGCYLANLQFDGANIARRVERLATLLPSLTFQPTTDSIMDYYSERWPGPGSSCNSLWRILEILPDLTVCACNSIELGRAGEQSLLRLWGSCRLEQMRAAVQAGRFLACCFRCCYMNFSFSRQMPQ